MQGSARCTQAGKTKVVKVRTAWMDNINMWTGFPMEESVKMTEDRDKLRKCVHDVANRQIKDG